MCQCTQNGQRKYNISAYEYNESRKNFSKIMEGNSYALGQKFSIETRQKMREAHIGKHAGVKNPMYGKHCSEECKKKLREKLYGDKNPSASKVQCIETGEIFNTVKSASAWCGIGHSDIAAFIRGK